MKKFVHVGLVLVVYAIVTWLLHVPLNPNFFWFWPWLFVTLLVVLFVVWRVNYEQKDVPFEGSSHVKPVVLGVLGCIAALAIAILIGSPIISAGTYAGMLKVEEASFEDFADELTVDAVSLMDTKSATLVGSRELGSLSDVVSQFDDDEYYQVIVGGQLQKVSALRYTGFFSWLNNNKRGTPGYVSVDPVHQDASYHQLEKGGLRYIPSAQFQQNLERHIWLTHPTYVLGQSHFELDEGGNPHYVTQVLGFKTFMGARYVASVIVTNPTTGEMKEYSADKVPEWLDVVYDGDLLDEMFDWHGTLSGGWLNSVMGKIGCTRTGGDYGYVMLRGEQWIYTGVTSMSGDASNIGFLLASEKTAEAYFIPMASADEASAMRSAEGKVQQFGYEASFPSLVLVDGQPSYVMVLKDSAGLVRMYAFVNAASYNVAACDPSLANARVAYRQAMLDANIELVRDEQVMPDVSSEDGASKGESTSIEQFTAKVDSFKQVVVNGDTYVYIISDDKKLYRAQFSEFPLECMNMQVGQTLSGSTSAAVDGVYTIQSIESVA